MRIDLCAGDRVLLVNVDCEWNLAIRRMWAYHEKCGCSVEVRNLEYGFYPHNKTCLINGEGYAQVCVSNIFETNAYRVEVINCDHVFYGGVGSRDTAARLPDEIERTPPKYTDDETVAHGFITRGCIRKCYFCKVPKHEGNIRAYRDVNEVVGNFKRAVFMDNNILAWSGANDALQWLVEHGTRCEFNQGLDIRLCNDENLSLLAALNYRGEYTFAFDDVSYMPMIERKFELVRKYLSKPWQCRFYVYVGPQMQPIDTVRRVEWCRDHKVLPYVMRDAAVYRTGSDISEFYTDLAAWCNQPAFFKKLEFDEFLAKRHLKNYARGGRSFEIYSGEARACEACWTPTPRLFEDETGNAICAKCVTS